MKASFICIGDEVLNGKVKEANTYPLAKALFEKGIELAHVEIIGDEQSAIIKAVREHSEKYDFVITSGGIGPTHDDITYEAIAKAFDCQLGVHQESLELLKNKISKKYKRDLSREPLTEQDLKMVRLPIPANVLYHNDLWVPVVVVRNVHILPGIPTLFEMLLEPVLRQYMNLEMFRELIYLTGREGVFAERLALIQDKFPMTKIGSYPKYKDLSVMISIEGRDQNEVLLAKKMLKHELCEFLTV